MQAVCKSNRVDLTFIKPNLYIDKEIVALVVVFADITLGLFFFGSLFFL